MDGHETFKQRRQAAVARRPSTRARAAGLELDDIDLFVYHQANARILEALGERLDLEPANASSTASAQLGNTSRRVVPLALALARARRPPAARA